MRLWALLLAAALAACPGPSKAPPARVYRDFDITMHADTRLNEHGREVLDRAAERLKIFTSSRARIHLVYDLDFESYIGLKEHLESKHSIIFGVLEGGTVANAIDGRHPRQYILAETAFLVDGSTRVVFIVNRIPAYDFEVIAIHELGHVIGFDDLPQHGSIMSGEQIGGTRLPVDFTARDLEHCRAKRYCD